MNDALYMDRLVSAVDELTLPYSTVNSVPYWDAARHRKFKMVRVDHPPLLVSLSLAVVPSGRGSDDGEGGRSAPGSRPAARLEAVDELERIKTGVLGWVELLALTSRHAIAADLRMLVGVGLNVSLVTLTRLSRDARGWACGARVVTGWEPPVFAPRVPCPRCECVTSLRIYPATRLGRCVACGVTWADDDGGFGVLVEHVRAESERAG